jgi:hypothetical protein
MDLVRFPNARGRQLAALRTLDPTEWQAVVAAALRDHGSVPDAAEALEVSTRTLWRWIADTPALRAIPIRGAGRVWPGK